MALAMPKAAKKRPIDRRVLRDTRARAVRLQVGALCYRQSKDGKLRVLLVTSRETRRWIVPKGWPMKKLPAAEAAAVEAWEEAGVRGTMRRPAIGFYRYVKDLGKGRAVRCTVQTFLMQVRTQERRFPEARERKVKWFSPRQAAKRVQEPGLRKMILDFAEAQKRAGSA